MAWFKKGNLRTYFEDVGKGEPIITSHGLMEDCGYWRDSGITARLAKQCRVICTSSLGNLEERAYEAKGCQ